MGARNSCQTNGQRFAYDMVEQLNNRQQLAKCPKGVVNEMVKLEEMG